MIKQTLYKVILQFFLILIISIILAGFLESLNPFSIDYKIIEFNILSFIKIIITPRAIVSAFTISAAVFAIFQYFLTRKEFNIAIETKALSSTDEIVEAMISLLTTNNIYNLSFRAAIPAVGKTGASEGLFNAFRRKFDEVIEIIKNEARLKYFDINNKELIKKFYLKKGLNNEDTINKLVEISETMHKTFKDHGAQINLIRRMKNLNPHFLIINTKLGRKGVIWNIDNISKERKVLSAGFITKNEEVINTILKFYDEE